MQDPSHFVHTVAVNPATPRQPTQPTQPTQLAKPTQPTMSHPTQLAQPTSNASIPANHSTINPTTNMSNTATTSNTNMWQQVLQETPIPEIDPALQPPTPYTQAKQMMQKVIDSKILVAVLVFMFTAVLLTILNPPIAQKSNDEKKTRSPGKILAWSSLTGLIAFVLPYAADLSKTKVSD